MIPVDLLISVVDSINRLALIGLTMSNGTRTGGRDLTETTQPVDRSPLQNHWMASSWWSYIFGRSYPQCG